jgi:hypothetical protein
MTPNQIGKTKSDTIFELHSEYRLRQFFWNRRFSSHCGGWVKLPQSEAKKV